MPTTRRRTHHRRPPRAHRPAPARAALFAAPDTLVTAKEFARAMGVRRLSASQSPQTARPIGGSLRAPFRDWLEAIGAASTPKRHKGAP
ncbi:MAG: hypothetical protein IPN01_31185 [Deltaproteobacteria bacterium]|nr:hypothetical protein [Deltaproteobacteria bacterium]